MSTVLAMRLNQRQALLLADESTWHLGHVFGYRRTNYGDSLAVLLDDQAARGAGVAAVYGGVGFPSLHDEVVRRARAELQHPGPAARWDGEGMARAVHRAFVAAHGRLVDDRLKFCYGFGRDALNSRKYVKDGRQLEIAQDGVVDAARAVAGGSAHGNAMDRIYSNSGYVLTLDPAHGILGWYLDSRSCALGFATPMDQLGEGGHVVSHFMGRTMEARGLMERRQGFELREGVVTALTVATEVRYNVGKMGGYFQMILVDGERGARELVSDAAHLAMEVMRAERLGLLGAADAAELSCALVLDGAEVGSVERELFARSSDQDRLLRCLMGRKPDVPPRPFLAAPAVGGEAE